MKAIPFLFVDPVINGESPVAVKTDSWSRVKAMYR